MNKNNWSKEQIMALIDGELDKNEESRIREIIQNDDEAKNIYEKFSMADDLLGITYNELEKSFVQKKEIGSSISQKQQKNEKPKGFGAITVSIGNLISGTLIIATLIAIAGYQIGLNNKQNTIESEKYFEMYAMNNVLNNEGILKKHIFSNSTNDLNIRTADNKTMLFKVIDREIKNDNFCQKYSLTLENREYIIEACNTDLKNKVWKYSLNQNSLK